MKFNIVFSLLALIVISTILVIVNLRKLRLINKNKKKKKGEYRFIELLFLEYKYGVDYKKLLNKKFICLISILNGIIISFTFLISSIIKVNYIFQLLIAFVLVFGLIYSLYGILGTILIKKGFKK